MSLLSFWPDGEERARPNEQEVQRACEAHIQNVTGWASEPEATQQSFISSAYGVVQHWWLTLVAYTGGDGASSWWPLSSSSPSTQRLAPVTLAPTPHM